MGKQKSIFGHVVRTWPALSKYFNRLESRLFSIDLGGTYSLVIGSKCRFSPFQRAIHGLSSWHCGLITLVAFSLWCRHAAANIPRRQCRYATNLLSCPLLSNPLSRLSLPSASPSLSSSFHSDLSSSTQSSPPSSPRHILRKTLQPGPVVLSSTTLSSPLSDGAFLTCRLWHEI